MKNIPRSETKPIGLPERIVAVMKNDLYHGQPHISSSQVKKAKHSLKKFYLSWSKKELETKSQSLDFGSVCHEYILENKMDSFCWTDIGDRRTKEFKSFASANEDKIILTIDEWTQINKMKESFNNHQVIKSLRMEKWFVEHSFFSNEKTGLSVRVRPDIYIEKDDSIIICDYKTTISADPKSFVNSIVNYSYDLSAVMYMRVVSRMLKKPIGNFFFMAQEKSAPYEIAVYSMDQDWVNRANIQLDKFLNRIYVSFMEEDFPGFEEVVTELQIPKWLNMDDGDGIF